jgi:hypothetical protein
VQVGAGADREQVAEQIGNPVGHGRWQRVVCGTALRDRTVEQPGGARRAQQRSDAEAAGGLPGDRDVVWIAAEALDVVTHPLERRDLVERAVDPRGRVLVTEPRQMRKAQRAEPIVDADHDDVAVVREARAVVPGDSPLPGLVGAPVDPEQHGPKRAVQRRRRDVQGQAVLVPAHVGLTGQPLSAKLWRRRTEAQRLSDVRPRRVRLRGLEAQGSDGRRGVRDAGKQDHAFLLSTLDPSSRGVGDRRHETPPYSCPVGSVLPNILLDPFRRTRLTVAVDMIAVISSLGRSAPQEINQLAPARVELFFVELYADPGPVRRNKVALLPFERFFDDLVKEIA